MINSTVTLFSRGVGLKFQVEEQSQHSQRIVSAVFEMPNFSVYVTATRTDTYVARV